MCDVSQRNISYCSKGHLHRGYLALSSIPRNQAVAVLLIGWPWAPQDTDTPVETMMLVRGWENNYRQHEIHRPGREADTGIERGTGIPKCPLEP